MTDRPEILYNASIMRIWQTGILFLFLYACGREPSPADALSPARSLPVQSSWLAVVDGQELDLDAFHAYCRLAVGTDPAQASPRMLSLLFDRFIEFNLFLADSRLHQVSVQAEDLARYRAATGLGTEDVSDQALAPFIQVQKHIQVLLSSHIEVSEEEVAAHYQTHRRSFQQQASIDLSQIVCKNRNEAEEIWTQLSRSPGQFEDLAQAHSVGVEAEKGGHMGVFSKGQLPAEMESVVFSLGTGRISPVVESSFGYHIFKVHERHQAHLVSLDEARPRIERVLYDQKHEAALQNLVQNLSRTKPPRIQLQNLPFAYEGRWRKPATSDHLAPEETP